MVNKRFWLVISVMVLVFGMTVVGCDNGSTSSSGGSVFTIYSSGYFGAMFYYGHHYSNSANNVDLNLYSESEEIYFEMFVPNGQNRLVEGTYNLNSNYEQFTYHIGALFTDDSVYYVTGGTVKISVSGSGDDAEYTIIFDCILSDENTGAAGTLKGTYTGTLEWYDEEDENGGFTPFNIQPRSNKAIN